MVAIPYKIDRWVVYKHTSPLLSKTSALFDSDDFRRIDLVSAPPPPELSTKVAFGNVHTLLNVGRLQPAVSDVSSLTLA